jgi:predicted lipoprotein with Yx(FWY)xxD motif
MSYRTLLSGVVALVGCVGYSEGSGSPPGAADAETSAPDTGVSEPAPAEDASDAPDARVPAPDAGSLPPADAEIPLDADVLFAHSSTFDGYLTDHDGRALYMLADDVAGTHKTTCLGECAKAWPPFDVEQLTLGPDLLVEEFTRFHRADGDWQTAYKGYPLYRKATEEGSREVTGDGAEGRWFVARDYLAFLGRSKTLAPAGSDSFNGLYLTNGVGRALYVCFDDTPGNPAAKPVTSCVGECALRRPLWSVVEAERSTILPSVLSPSDLGQFLRPDNVRQLTYRGWPLYYFTEDQTPGELQGHNQEAWRLLDPVGFTGPTEQP